MSRNRQAKTILISGSMTRSPYLPKNRDAPRGRPTTRSAETPTNGTIQRLGLMNRIDSAAAVPKSVTNVADIRRLPVSVWLSPVSTSTA